MVWNIGLYLVVVGAGASVALQQVLNTNLRHEIGSPWWAGFASYLVGSLVMLALALGARGPHLWDVMSARTSAASWFGGVFGAIFIGTAILMVPRLGVATVLALMVVGQMIGAMAIDHVGLLGIPQHAISPIRLAGALLLIIGVVMVRL